MPVRPRRFSAGALALAAAVALSACAGAPASSNETQAASTDGAFPVTVTHAFGETTIPKHPERIVALGAGTDGEILYSLGITPVGLATFPGFGAANSDGVMPWVEPFVDSSRTTFLPDGAEGVEQVAALRPDLILVTYGALEDTSYKRLSTIAPTVASPGGPWELDWRLELETVAKAVGKEPEARELEQNLSSGIQDLKNSHPELQGIEYTYVEVYDHGLWPYLSADPRNQLIAELGLVASPGVRALDTSTGGAFVGDISFERATDIDAQVLIAYTNIGDAASVLTTPVFGQLPSVRSGAIAAYGQEDIAFLASLQPSPLTIPLSLKRLATDLSTAVGHIR